MHYIPGAGFVKSSMFRPRSYSPTYFRRSYTYDDDALIYPVHIPRKNFIDTSAEENYLRSHVNKELYVSGAALEDTFDLASQSRNRDQQLLSKAHKAIPPTAKESTTSSNQTNASRRFATLRRTSSMPPSRRRPYTGTSLSSPFIRTTNTVIPLDLSSSPVRDHSPFYEVWKKLDNTRRVRDGSYQPSYPTSGKLAAGYIPHSVMSPCYSPLTSPYDSGTQTPVERYAMSPDRDGRDVSPYYRKKRKPRVISTKRRLGNYYDRLLKRRACRPGKEPRNWPYLDVESIDGEDVDDLFSETASVSDGAGIGNTYIFQTASPDDTDNYDDTDNIPRSVEYIPFKPRWQHSIETNGYDSSVPREENFSISTYCPKRDYNFSNSTISDDIKFNAIVTAAAIRARQALRGVNLDEFDDAKLVLSVEGEYNGPKSEVPVGFHYVSRPIPLKVPAALRVSVSDSDSIFTKYLKDMQEFRAGIRSRLEEGYRFISEHVPRVSTSLSSLTYPHHSTRVSPAPLRLRIGDSRLDGIAKMDLYPLHTKESRNTLRDCDSFLDRHSVSLFDSELEPLNKVSTLDRIKIKVNTQLHSSPRYAVVSRRAARSQSVPPSDLHRKVVKEAALVGSKVDIVLPEKRRPKSVYAQSKMRQLRKEEREQVPGESTEGLKAHRPFRLASPKRPIRDAGGYTNPNNILSWQYKLLARISPDAMLSQPVSFNKMRDQMREVQDKMDRQKQLLDRYMPIDSDLKLEDPRFPRSEKVIRR